MASTLAGAWFLIAALVVALAWANGPFSASYTSLWLHPVQLGAGLLGLTTVRAWVTSVTMAIFFLVVGLEIGRERRDGELRDLAAAVPSLMGALGGMVGTGLVYVAFNHSGVAGRGWGIPMATDVAFALGALALLGHRAPTGLRIFLLTLAVADDIGSVVVLAAFYSDVANWTALVLALVLVVALVIARWRFGVPVWTVLVGGVVLWCLLARAGVEPALAGVVAGLAVPNRVRNSDRDPAEDLERRLAPISAFVVLPLFALANAGVVVHLSSLFSGSSASVFAGVAVARLVGKLVGITAFVWIGVRLGWGMLPTGVRWSHLAGGAAVAGIGFAVPLLIAEQAFPGAPVLVDASVVGLLVGSLLAGLVGAGILIMVNRRSSMLAGKQATVRTFDGPPDPEGSGGAITGNLGSRQPPNQPSRSEE